MITYAVIGTKGSIGKTTTSAHFGALVADMGLCCSPAPSWLGWQINPNCWLPSDQRFMEIAWGFAGFYYTPAGNLALAYANTAQSQEIFPAFAAADQLGMVLKQVDPQATWLIQPDGSAKVAFLGLSFRFLPDWAVVATPVAHAQDAYWVEGGKIFLNNQDGSCQGFTVAVVAN